MLRLAIVAALGVAACERVDHDTVCAPTSARVSPPVLDTDPAPVIIHFKRGVDLAELAATGRAGRRHMIDELQRDSARVRTLLAAHGVTPRASLWMIGAVAVTIPRALVDELAQLPEVARIQPDVVVHIPIEPHGSAAAPGWNLAAIRAPALWATGKRGAGTIVAVLDSGVDVAHPALAATWRSSAGWFDPYAQHAAPFDSDGHGTQVAGLAVGEIGVAPDARWIAAKIYDDSGVASLSAIHLALQWVLDPDGDPATDDAADVVIASWGYRELVDECFLELEPDLAALRAAQIAPVFAAGNTGPYLASSISPANNPSAFAVGAVDEQFAVIDASARGPSACAHSVYPALVAPGANVLTTDRTLGVPDSYVSVSGTSFAAPHVAGAMALLRSAHPSATVTQIADALTATAADLAPTGTDTASGFGLIDVAAADAWLTGRVSTCTDADRDGFFEEPGCGTALDCDDESPAIHPGACCD